MNKHITSPISILLMVLLVGAFLTACGASQTPTAPAATTLDGQALLQERCTVCHNLSRVTSAHKTADQWTATVERMIGHGAQLDAQEKQTLIDYLAQAYP